MAKTFLVRTFSQYSGDSNTKSSKIQQGNSTVGERQRQASARWARENQSSGTIQKCVEDVSRCAPPFTTEGSLVNNSVLQ